MASTEQKTTVKYSDSFDLDSIEKDSFEETKNFSAPDSSTSFYLRLTREGQVSLHLATCWQEKLHIDSFYVVARCPIYSIKNHNLSKDISLDESICCSLPFDDSDFSVPWEIDCEITYREPHIEMYHEKKLTNQLAALRWNTEYSDVTLVTMADGREHRAHKWILSMRSPVFAAMFKQEGVVENVLNRVEIEDVSGQAMKIFLDYVYSGNTRNVCWYAAQQFILANKYDVQPLAQACIEAVKVTNAAQLYYLADLHQQVNYKRMVMRFISKNKQAVKKTKGWNEFIKPSVSLLDQLIDYL